jgi:hypothetical protein
VWGPGKDYVDVYVDLEGMLDPLGAIIGGQPGGVTPERGWDEGVPE